MFATHAPDRVLPWVLHKGLRRSETWAKAEACVANIVTQARVMSHSTGEHEGTIPVCSYTLGLVTILMLPSTAMSCEMSPQLRLAQPGTI